MFEITKIFGRISTGIMYKQRNEVANLAKYVHMQGLYTFEIGIYFSHKILTILHQISMNNIQYLDKYQLCSYQKNLENKLK